MPRKIKREIKESVMVSFLLTSCRLTLSTLLRNWVLEERITFINSDCSFMKISFADIV